MQACDILCQILLTVELIRVNPATPQHLSTEDSGDWEGSRETEAVRQSSGRYCLLCGVPPGQ